MRLFIMRHGPSEERAPSGRDFDRSLSASGRKRTAAVARELLRRGERPERIVSSPLVRAVQTAALVASVFGGTSTEVHEELAPSEDAYDLVLELVWGSAQSVLLVGHAPDVTLLAERLVGRKVAAFGPATIAALEVADGKATRLFTLDAAALEP
jgi:phosphohistidine phosphatase